MSTTRSSRYVLASTALAAGLVLSGCGSSDTPGSQAGVVHHLDASWADAFPTVDEMTANADVVITGVVLRVADTGVFPADSGGGDASDGNYPVPYTDFTVQVTAPIKGGPSGQIIVRQTGGQAPDGSVTEVSDDPLLVPHDRVLLFLHQFGDNQYYVLGGPTGRVDLDASGSMHTLPGSILKVGDKSLPQLKNTIATAAAKG